MVCFSYLFVWFCWFRWFCFVGLVWFSKTGSPSVALADLELKAISRSSCLCLLSAVITELNNSDAQGECASTLAVWSELKKGVAGHLITPLQTLPSNACNSTNWWPTVLPSQHPALSASGTNKML